MKISLCAIAKNENLYIREWIEWYLKLGIDKIFLYDNNEKDGERFEDVISDFIKSEYVTIINVRGIEKGLSYDKDDINLQPKCYFECYEKYGKDYDWMCFFDIDEFFYSKQYTTIKDFLNYEKYKNFSTILIPWETHDDGGNMKFESVHVQDRFKSINTSVRCEAKSIVRTGRGIRNKKLPRMIHSFCTKDGMMCDVFGNKVDVDETNFYVYKEDIRKANAVLRHYKTKTFEEFVKRQFKRHWGTGHSFTKKELTYDDVVRLYFKINKKTDEKLHFVEEYRKKIYKNMPVIVSMTSWKKRVNNLIPVLESMLKQTKKPEKIVINLSSEEFKNKENDLPVSLLNFINTNKNLIEIYWVEGKNTKQWKKFIPTMKRFPNSWILCIDDDKIYQENLIEMLWKKHIDFPYNPICGGTCVYKGLKCHAGPCSLINSIFFKDIDKYLCDEIFTLHSSDIFFTWLAKKNGYRYVQCGYDFERYAQKYNEIEPMHTEKTNGSKIAIMWDYLTNKYGDINTGNSNSNMYSSNNPEAATFAETFGFIEPTTSRKAVKPLLRRKIVRKEHRV